MTARHTRIIEVCAIGAILTIGVIVVACYTQPALVARIWLLATEKISAGTGHRLIFLPFQSNCGTFRILARLPGSGTSTASLVPAITAPFPVQASELVIVIVSTAESLALRIPDWAQHYRAQGLPTNQLICVHGRDPTRCVYNCSDT